MSYARWTDGDDNQDASDVYVYDQSPIKIGPAGISGVHCNWIVQLRPTMPEPNNFVCHTLQGLKLLLMTLEYSRGVRVPQCCWNRIEYELTHGIGLLSGRKVILGDEN